MRAAHFAIVLGFIALAAGNSPAGVVLTPYRTTDAYVETRYPTYPYPNYPTLAVYRTATDQQISNTGGHVSVTAMRPGDATTSYGLAEAMADYGQLHSGSDASASPDLTTEGTAIATSSFGDGFVVQGGPASGIARIAVTLEGYLDYDHPSYGAVGWNGQLASGAWVTLDVTLRQNYVGGGTLTHSVIYPNRVQSDSMAPGVQIGFGDVYWNPDDRFFKTVIFTFPYEADRDYFMDLSLTTTASRFGFAHFMNTGRVTGFSAEEGASISFLSGAPLDDYNRPVPEPASATLLVAMAGMLAVRRRS